MEVLLSYSRHHNVCPQFEMTHQKHLDSLESYHMLLYDCGFLHIRCLRDANELALHRWCYMAIGEMPSHSHSGTAQRNGAHTHGMTISSQQSAGGSYHIRKTDSPTTETYQTTSAGAHTHTLSINNTGGGESHNNLQPYIAVYRWLRTA